MGKEREETAEDAMSFDAMAHSLAHQARVLADGAESFKNELGQCAAHLYANFGPEGQTDPILGSKARLADDLLSVLRELWHRAPRWISLERRKPEQMSNVLCIDAEGDMWTVTYDGSGMLYEEGAYIPATHWQPLPDPPKEVNS